VNVAHSKQGWEIWGPKGPHQIDTVHVSKPRSDS